MIEAANSSWTRITPATANAARMVIWEDATISFGLSVLPKHSQVELGPPWDRRTRQRIEALARLKDMARNNALPPDAAPPVFDRQTDIEDMIASKR